MHRWQPRKTIKAAGAGPPPSIYVSGTIGTDGTASFDPYFTLTTSGGPPPVPGDYTVEMEDANGQVLASQSFTPLRSFADSSSTLTSYPFGVTLPFPTGTASIVLMQGTQQLALRAVPAHRRPSS